jgi:hypothetical protein
VHLDGERAIWVSDDGRWHWDAEAQSWKSRPTDRGDPTEPVKTPAAPHESLPEEPAPAAHEPLGLDAGLGLDRAWSPPGAKPDLRKLRRAWSGERTSRPTRLLLAGIAAAVLTGGALAVLLPGGGADTVTAPPAPAHAYSTEAQESYLQQCRANAGESNDLCGCSLARFQARYSQEDFIALQGRFAARDPTAVQQFTAIAAACLPH